MSETPIRGSDIKQVVKAHWGNRAPSFDDAPNHGIHSGEQRDAWLDILRRLTGGEHLRVLDIGCGTGFLSLLLTGMGNAVEGLDIAPAMLDRARAKAVELGLEARFFEGDAESLAMEEATYDLIVERHVIWTLPHPALALREWRRVLRPGGRVALIEGDWGRRDRVQPDYEAIHAALPLYGGTPSPVLAAMLVAAGFGDIATEPLANALLWGVEAVHDRYLLTGIRV